MVWAATIWPILPSDWNSQSCFQGSSITLIATSPTSVTARASLANTRANRNMPGATISDRQSWAVGTRAASRSVVSSCWDRRRTPTEPRPPSVARAARVAIPMAYSTAPYWAAGRRRARKANARKVIAFVTT